MPKGYWVAKAHIYDLDKLKSDGSFIVRGGESNLKSLVEFPSYFPRYRRKFLESKKLLKVMIFQEMWLWNFHLMRWM